MSKKVETKVLEYVSGLKKSSTWEDAWNKACEMYPLDSELVIDLKNANFTILWKDEVINKIITPKESVMGKSGDIGDINYDYFFKRAFDYIIKHKYIKKNSSKKIVLVDSLVDDLKRQRTALYTKIYLWKKQGKDITELLKQKEELSKQIKGN